MHSFEELSREFTGRFDTRHFPSDPSSLYEPAGYFLSIGGKRVRPILCLMGNELFGEISPDAWPAAIAVELFHNFTLIHDDIMDKAPIRRGMPTVHEKYGSPTALLAGDVMLVVAYDYLNRIGGGPIHEILQLFNRTARQVCEGQQIDMDFEKKFSVDLNEYLHMIELKTSVLLAASLQMGAILGGAGKGNQQHIFEFGRNLGLAFQIQDDYLDAFGDPAKFGKQLGGDIVANKKTFLLVKAMEVANSAQYEDIRLLLETDIPDKVQQMLHLFRVCGVDAWARALKENYIKTAFRHLEEIAVISSRKEPLRKLAEFLVQREY